MRATPKPITIIYKRGRHNCWCCREDIKAGERVLLSAVGENRTWALHEKCADVRLDDERVWRDFMEQHSADYYRRSTAKTAALFSSS